MTTSPREPTSRRDAGADLSCRLDVDGVAEGTMTIDALRAVERLSTPFEYTLDGSIPIEDEAALVRWSGRDATLLVHAEGGAGRTVHGVVAHVARSGSIEGGRRARIVVTIVPRLARLADTSGRRVFSTAMLREIVTALLRPRGVELDWRVRPEPPIHEHRVQAGETDLAFLLRVAAADGVHFFFEHRATASVLVFANRWRGHAFALDGATIEREGARFADERVTSTGERPRFADERVTNTGERARSADERVTNTGERARFVDERVTNTGERARSTDERVTNTGERARSTDERVTNTGERARSTDEGVTSTGEGTCAVIVAKWGGGAPWSALSPGTLLVPESLGATTLGRLVVTDVDLRIAFTPRPADASIHPEPVVARVVAVAAEPFGPPARLPKPRARLQLARVVGPRDGEPHVDDFGRIQLELDWDHGDAPRDQRRFWVLPSIADPAAGAPPAQLPVGSDVVVDFADGDIDRPTVMFAVSHPVEPPGPPSSTSAPRSSSIPGRSHAPTM